MNTLELRRRNLDSYGITNSFWGDGAAMICRTGLRRHTDVTAEALEIEIVAVKSANDSNDFFDVRKNGTLVGVGNIDCDFQRWLHRQYARGYRHVYVNEIG